MAEITDKVVRALFDTGTIQESGLENKLTELLNYLDFVKSGRAFRDQYSMETGVPFIHHKAAQKAVDELRTLIPKIIDDHRRMPERYAGESLVLSAAGARFEKWIADAPVFMLSEKKPLEWHNVAHHLLLLYRSIVPGAKISKSGPAMRFLERSLDLCGFDVSQEAIIKMFEREG